MCLAIPGQVVDIREEDGVRVGNVRFGGILRETCLAYVENVQPGDYVLVHAGFAISIVDEDEAKATLAIVDALEPADDGSKRTD